MGATLQKYIPLHCCCSLKIYPTLVHTLLKYVVPGVNSNKVMGMMSKSKAAKCKLSSQMTNKHVFTTMLHVCTYVQNLNLLQQKLWSV